MLNIVFYFAAETTAKKSPESRPTLKVSTNQECKKSFAKKSKFM